MRLTNLKLLLAGLMVSTSFVTPQLAMGTGINDEARLKIESQIQETDEKIALADELMVKVAELADQKKGLKTNKVAGGVTSAIAVITLAFAFSKNEGPDQIQLGSGLRTLAALVGFAATVTAGYNGVKIMVRSDKIEELEKTVKEAREELRRQSADLQLFKEVIDGQ